MRENNLRKTDVKNIEKENELNEKQRLKKIWKKEKGREMRERKYCS